MSDACSTVPAGSTFLLVDDSELFRNTLARVLNHAGHVALHACTPEEALTVAERERPAYAVVNLRMPGKETLGVANDWLVGVWVIRELRRRLPAMRVVACSGHACYDTAMAAVAVGATTCVPKFDMATNVLAAFNDTTPFDPGWRNVYGNPPTLASATSKALELALLDCNQNKSRAARQLGLSRGALQARLRNAASDRSRKRSGK